MNNFGHAQTYVSQAVTNRFYNIDRIMFSWSPWLTDEESWRIVKNLERLATSSTEGNFTAGDALTWMAEQLGPDRYQALCHMWTLNSQTAIQQLYTPEQLRPAWIHKITLTEATQDQVALNPDLYVQIQTTRDEYK